MCTQRCRARAHQKRNKAAEWELEGLRGSKKKRRKKLNYKPNKAAECDYISVAMNGL